MRSPGIGSVAVFAHLVPHSGPYAALPPHDDIPRCTQRGHLTIAAETSPAPTASVGLETSDYPPFRHLLSRASSTVQRGESRTRAGHPHRNLPRCVSTDCVQQKSDGIINDKHCGE